MDTSVVKRQNNDLLDLLKFILSFLIVAIHTHLFDPYLYPWLRLAVPLFFIVSSYLFFTKINACTSNVEKLTALKNFVLRNLKLYAFWFVVLFPINIFTRGWFDGGFWSGILTIIQSFFLASTFTASWFIMALIIGVSIVFFASKKLNNTSLFIIGTVIFVLICIRSAYMFLFKDPEWVQSILVGVVKYENIMCEPMTSFPVGIFWIVCGKMFADGAFSRFKIKASSVVLAVSAGLLLTEWLILKHFSGNFNKDSYLMLAPCSIAIFNILIQLKPVSLKYAREMRKISIIVYASHGAVISCISYLFNLAGWSAPSVIKFFLTVIICVGGAILILYLEKKKYFTWLKYSH